MNEITKVNNPITALQQNNVHQTNAVATVAGMGEVARVQQQLVSAKNFPRNESQAVDKILTAFQRRSLAEIAVYQYARGGSDISGLSIRAAEAVATAWGNIDFGFRELENTDTESIVEAYAWDLESNTRRSITFTVPHYRDTRNGKIKLNDGRDVYELVANQQSRRVRACILAVIPRDVQDSVLEQVFETQKASVSITPEKIKSMLDKFAEYGITKGQIETRIQRRIDSITPAQMIALGRIYNSLKDGIAAVSDFFEAERKSTIIDRAKSVQKTEAEEPVSTLEDELKKRDSKFSAEDVKKFIESNGEIYDEQFVIGCLDGILKSMETESGKGKK